MDIGCLKAVLPPPRSPVEVGSPAEWERVKRLLGIELPTDYKEFIGRYGTGVVDQFIWVLNPFADNENLNLLQQAEVIASGYRSMREAFPERFPYSVFPEMEGLLPWAVTDNGDVLYWHTRGDPECWPTVAYDARSPEHYEYAEPMGVLLAGLVTRRLVCPLFPEEFFEGAPRFQKENEVTYC